MKTIVINTSKEANKTKLDILFNAPFDCTSLLWYESKLEEISSLTAKIKEALITNADTIDRDYNLIVLVDVYEFPYGNETDAVRIYKALITNYIKSTLSEKLHTEYNLPPLGTSVYFADSSKQSKGLDLEKLDDNPHIQIEKELQKYLQIKKNEVSLDEFESDDDLDDTDTLISEEPKYSVKRSPFEKRLMELFSWSDSAHSESFNWKIKTSIAEDTFIDFSDTFKDLAISIEKSYDKTKNLNVVLEHITSVLTAEKGQWDEVAVTELDSGNNLYIRSLSCHFERDNEQTLIEGFFNVYANIFICVQNGELSDSVVYFSSDEIKDLLIDALKKYKYFAEEKNIQMEFEPINLIFEHRSKILKKHKEKALENSVYKDNHPDSVAQDIMNLSNGNNTESYFNVSEMNGTDKSFFALAESIFNNYNEEVIKRQNSLIIKNCLVNLWDWKNKSKNNDFRKLVNHTIEKEIKPNVADTVLADATLSRDTIDFIRSEHDKEYTELVNDITNVEHRLSSNKNILNEANELIVKFSDLMRKSKRYLVSFIGSIVAVLASVFPYIYIQIYSTPTTKTEVSFIMFLLFTAGIAFLYMLASGIYLAVISHKKSTLLLSLTILKDSSEKDRKESIIDLYNYYTNTIIEANCHYLLWNEILRMDAQNAQKGIKRNAHINRFSKLVAEVERYLTMLKIDISDINCTAENGCKIIPALDGEKPFYDENNRKVYSVLPENAGKPKNTEEGEV